eukprot:GFUD01075272.1.p1 GENE.GFUD01075272.1~~GFUD01075272.1.p1  ORF type:complete len:123 (-),score=33.63 GFUD01075272.1:87-455(-)
MAEVNPSTCLQKSVNSDQTEDLSLQNKNTGHIQPQSAKHSADDFDPDEDPHSLSCSPSPPPPHLDQETTSIRSDNSFLTASSDPQLNLLPARVTDCYSILASKLDKVVPADKNGAVINKKTF